MSNLLKITSPALHRSLSDAVCLEMIVPPVFYVGLKELEIHIIVSTLRVKTNEVLHGQHRGTLVVCRLPQARSHHLQGVKALNRTGALKLYDVRGAGVAMDVHHVIQDYGHPLVVEKTCAGLVLGKVGPVRKLSKMV